MYMQVGPQGVGLKVKEPKKYNFDPKSLLLQICEVSTHQSTELHCSGHTIDRTPEACTHHQLALNSCLKGPILTMLHQSQPLHDA